MDPKIRELIGLQRHQIISPVLMESGKAQMAYFKELETREFDVPGKGIKRFTATTMKGWLYRYRKNGFAGLTPRVRKDAGQIRVLSDEAKQKIKSERQSYLNLSCVKFY